jgi:vacuolar-type H+-ATPase subunit E/Vma4
MAYLKIGALYYLNKRDGETSWFWYFLLLSSGGVVLASRDGKIVFENSLDARLDVAFRKKLPEVCS